MCLAASKKHRNNQTQQTSSHNGLENSATKGLENIKAPTLAE